MLFIVNAYLVYTKNNTEKVRLRFYSKLTRSGVVILKLVSGAPILKHEMSLLVKISCVMLLI